ncbi:hypothetical protein GINT2_001866 [Glugoides intestinalis]
MRKPVEKKKKQPIAQTLKRQPEEPSDVKKETGLQLNISEKQELTCGKFIVNDQKYLFKKEKDDKIFIQKLARNIFKMCLFEEKVYFIDAFGDCFLIENEKTVFLFGILSYPQYFTVLNHRIYAVDKYSRIWVHELDGEILNIAFAQENILSMQINENYCHIVTNGKKNEVEYGQDKQIDITERKLMIFDRSFVLLNEYTIEKLVESNNQRISYQLNGNLICLKIDDYNSRKNLDLKYKRNK